MQPVTVSAVRPEMHLDRNARAFQREIPRKCVLNADAVILRLNQERGRNIRIDFEFRRKIQLQIRKIRGIDQRGEVRAVRECVDFIRRRIRNRIRRCGNRRAKVRPRREADRADFVRNDVEFFRIRADHAHRARSVRMSGGAAVRTAVFEQKRAESVLVQHPADVASLMVPREDGIAAAGTYQHGGVRSLSRGGKPGDGRFGDVSQTVNAAFMVLKMFNARSVVRSRQGNILFPQFESLSEFHFIFLCCPWRREV